jgi:hypothetical protein
MLSAISTNSPPHRARTIIRIILIAFGILVVAMWAAVGYSVVTARQQALEDANAEGRNLMVAFRERSPPSCAGSKRNRTLSLREY